MSKLLLIFIAYFSGALLGKAISPLNEGVFHFWPPAGIYFLALVLMPKSRWVYVVVTAMAANLFFDLTFSYPQFGESLGYAILNTVAAVMTARIFLGPQATTPSSTDLERPQTLVRFFMASLLGPMIAAFLGAAFYCVTIQEWGYYWTHWFNWFFADSLGILVFAPVGLTWTRLRHLRWKKVRWRRFVEMTFLVTGVVLLANEMFAHTDSFQGNSFRHTFWFTPLLLWSGLRFGIGEASVVVCTLTFSAVYRTVTGQGIFANDLIVGTSRLFPLHAYVMVTTSTIFAIVSLMAARRKTESRLRENYRLLQAVAHGTHNAVTVKDREGRYLMANPVAARYLGSSTEDIIGNTDFDYFGEKINERVREVDSFVMEHGSSTHFEDVVQCKDGVLRTLLITKTPYKDVDGNIIGVINVAHDVTQRKAIEQEMKQAVELSETANRAKSQFLANVSHEIRTPMNAILGLTELTLDSQLTNQQEENLCMIHDAASSLMVLLNDLLDFARIEEGRLQLYNEPFRIRDLVQQFSKLILPRAHEKKLEFKVEIDVHVPDVMRGDSRRLHQVFTNLIGNALKFTASGHIHLFIKLKERVKEELVLECCVEDTGVGVPLNRQKEIFEPFIQGDGSMTRSAGGTGLGLAICKEIVALMKGRIWLKSLPGKGSQFLFTVFLQKASLEDVLQLTQLPNVREKTPEKISDQPMVFHASHARVLVAEDNPINQRVIELMLKKNGCEVTLVGNGKEAVELADPKKFDIVLMDLQMPVMSGIEAARTLSRKFPTLPIIALTAHALKSDRERCMEAGMADYLVKPVTETSLLRMIGAHMENTRHLSLS